MAEYRYTNCLYNGLFNKNISPELRQKLWEVGPDSRVGLNSRLTQTEFTSKVISLAFVAVTQVSHPSHCSHQPIGLFWPLWSLGPQFRDRSECGSLESALSPALFSYYAILDLVSKQSDRNALRDEWSEERSGLRSINKTDIYCAKVGPKGWMEKWFDFGVDSH